jgi:hypothetical protein
VSKPRLYDDNLVTNWPQVRVHPVYYDRIGELALRDGKTINSEVHLLLGTLLEAIEEKELET